MAIFRAVWRWLQRLGRGPYRGKRDRVSEAGERALSEIHGRGGF